VAEVGRRRGASLNNARTRVGERTHRGGREGGGGAAAAGAGGGGRKRTRFSSPSCGFLSVSLFPSRYWSSGISF
jgi:hypothetical protein